MYTLDKVKILMLKHLKSFGVYSETPTYDSKFVDLLPDSDGYGTATSRRLFKGVVIRDLVNAGHDKKKCAKWPKKWVDMNISTLSIKISGVE